MEDTMIIRKLLPYALIPSALLLLQACGGGSSNSSSSGGNNNIGTSNQPSDTTAPTLYMKGSTPLLLPLGESFNDPGALAIDDVDGDISYLVSESNNINTSIAGCYTQSFTVEDSSGNTSRASRTVFVGTDSERHSPNTAPVSAEDAVTTNNYETVNIDVLANDSDAECDQLNDYQHGGLSTSGVTIASTDPDDGNDSWPDTSPDYSNNYARYSTEKHGRAGMTDNAEQHEKINYIELPAKDIDKAKAFFSDVFAWTFEDFGPEYTAIHNAGIDGGFYKSDLTVSAKTGSALIVFLSNDLEGTQQKVENSGGKIIEDIFSFPGGRRFHFTDPNGNEYAVWTKT
ncbi:hypothetical protein GQR58_020426 [Nymphon striatum]|nr:hypothetical protein GQR58_020426 [Nymphon striatum]